MQIFLNTFLSLTLGGETTEVMRNRQERLLIVKHYIGKHNTKAAEKHAHQTMQVK